MSSYILSSQYFFKSEKSKEVKTLPAPRGGFKTISSVGTYRNHVDLMRSKGKEVGVEAYGPFAYRIYRRYLHMVDPSMRDDVLQEAMLGMMIAQRKLDVERGSFFTLAKYYVLGTIRVYIRNVAGSVVRKRSSRGHCTAFFLVKALWFRLKNTGDVSSIEEASPKILKMMHRQEKYKGYTEKDVVHILQWDTPVDWIHDETWNGDSKHTLEDLCDEGSEERILHSDLMKKILPHMAKFRQGLNDREAFIYDHRLMAEDESKISLNDLGKAFSYPVSRERARQLEAKLLKRLKEYLIENCPEIVKELV